MRISKKSRYGVRMMLELTMEYGKGYIFLREIARKQEIPEKYLSQIVLILKSRGLVSSSRGAKGGHMLARPPSEISIRDIVEALEGDPGIVDCVQNPSICSRRSACVVGEFWSELQKSVSDTLGATTLADLGKKCFARRKKERAKSGKKAR